MHIKVTLLLIQSWTDNSSLIMSSFLVYFKGTMTAVWQ